MRKGEHKNVYTYIQPEGHNSIQTFTSRFCFLFGHMSNACLSYIESFKSQAGILDEELQIQSSAL